MVAISMESVLCNLFQVGFYFIFMILLFPGVQSIIITYYFSVHPADSDESEVFLLGDLSCEIPVLSFIDLSFIAKLWPIMMNDQCIHFCCALCNLLRNICFVLSPQFRKFSPP